MPKGDITCYTLQYGIQCFVCSTLTYSTVLLTVYIFTRNSLMMLHQSSSSSTTVSLIRPSISSILLSRLSNVL